MSDSRPNIRDVIKNGQFTVRDLNSMPEDRPRRDSSSTIDSEPSLYPHRRGGSSESSRNAAREGDVMLLPLDLGIDGLEPDFYLTATPSIITYTVGRGYSSVRMEEIDLPNKKLSIIEEMPSPTETLHNNGFPMIAPPPNFKPIHGSSSGSEHNSIAMSPAQAQYPRQGSHFSQVLQSSQSMRSLTSNGDEESGGRTPAPPSSPWSLSSPTANMPPLPSQSTRHSVNEKSGPWPLPDGANSPGGSPAELCPPYSDYTTAMNTLQNSPTSKEFQDLKSRFSWCDREDKKRSWMQRWVHDWWLLELTCLFLSALFMAVICILGAYYDGSEIPEVWTFGVTLNAMIAILAAFSRICLFFPTAEVLGQLKWHFSNKRYKRVEDFEISNRGRPGPMESIKLLARTKRITWGSIIGALFLLALPMDFFFQQLIHYPNEWLLSSAGNGTTSRGVNYSPALTTFTSNGTTLLFPEPVLDSSIFPFALSNGRDVPLEFDCPTNNCTFQPFWTIALESRCREMPSILRQSCETGPAQWLPSTIASPTNGTYIQGNSCGWYVDGVNPTGEGTLPILMSGYSTVNDTKREAMVGRMLPLRDIFTKQLTLGNFTSYNFQEIQYPVIDFLVSSTPDGIDGAYNTNAPVLHECVVYWTAQKLKMTIFEGRPAQKVLETKLLDYGGDSSQPAYMASGKYVGNYSMTLPDGNNKTTLTIDNLAARRVNMVMEELAASSYFAVNDTSPMQFKWLWTSTPPRVTAAPPVEDGWFQGTEAGLAAHLARLVTSMNHVIYQTDNSKTQKSDVFLGQAWRQSAVVRIRWIWITVPGALLLFSAIFMIATIVKNSGDEGGLGVWRTAAVTVKVKKSRSD